MCADMQLPSKPQMWPKAPGYFHWEQQHSPCPADMPCSLPPFLHGETTSSKMTPPPQSTPTQHPTCPGSLPHARPWVEPIAWPRRFWKAKPRLHTTNSAASYFPCPLKSSLRRGKGALCRGDKPSEDRPRHPTWGELNKKRSPALFKHGQKSSKMCLGKKKPALNHDFLPGSPH